MPAVFDLAALNALANARLDFVRENKGTKSCQRLIVGLRRNMERMPVKLSALTPEMMDIAQGRKSALATLAVRCQECGKCAMADDSE